MELRKLLIILNWVFIAGAIILFYIGLRYDEEKWFYTLSALGLWGISFLINRQIKKMDSE